MSRGRSKLSGVSEFRRRLRALSDDLKEAIREEMDATASAVHETGLANIDRMTDRDTGLLRRHYTLRQTANSLKASVGYRGKRARRAAFYARWVHDGTASTLARPFHDRALLKHLPAYEATMRRIAELVLGRRLR